MYKNEQKLYNKGKCDSKKEKLHACGAAVLISYGLVFIVGQCGLKDLIARARPCQLDETVELLVKRPSSYSCPSTHSAWAFAAATSILLYFRKAGIGVMLIAALIGFSCRNCL